MKSENVLHNKMVEAFGGGQGQVSNSSTVSRSNIRMELFQVPGFQHLNWLMPHHVAIPEVYFLLAAILLGRPVKDLPSSKVNDKLRLDLDSIWESIFGTKASDVGGQNQTEMINEKIRIRWGYNIRKANFLKFIYSEKPTKFCEISNVDLSYVVPVKSRLEILQNFMAFSKYVNFTIVLL